jgi:hypothetical protein
MCKGSPQHRLYASDSTLRTGKCWSHALSEALSVHPMRIKYSVSYSSQRILSSRPTSLFLFEFPLIHTVDIGMGKDHSVCRKVVTDTGCVDWRSHSRSRCISIHESQRFVEGEPQFNLKTVSKYSIFFGGGDITPFKMTIINISFDNL